jgi:biopolymer transport protein ExbB/TolQ
MLAPIPCVLKKMGQRKSKIEIIDVHLDVNLADEIKKQTETDANTRAQIDNIIESAKQRKPQSRVSPEDQAWNDKFEKLFKAMVLEDGSSPSLTKNTVAELLETSIDKLGAVISRYKKFLRNIKSDEWTLILDKNAQRERVYSLQKQDELST